MGKRKKSRMLENIFKGGGIPFQHQGLRPVRRKKDILLHYEIIREGANNHGLRRTKKKGGPKSPRCSITAWTAYA